MRIVVLALFACGLCWGQATDECKPSTLNNPGARYPCVYPDGRATFRVAAPEAQKVQVRVGRAFDMDKGPDGAWTVTTTPLIIVMDNLNALRPGEDSSIFNARGGAPPRAPAPPAAGAPAAQEARAAAPARGGGLAGFTGSAFTEMMLTD